MSLPIKKIYVDSRFKSTDSKSDSSFKFELAQTLTMPRNTVCYIDDVTLPHSWFNVNKDTCRLYIEIFSLSTTFALELPYMNYNGPTLQSALQVAINAVQGDMGIDVTYTVATNIIKIISTKNTTTFRLWTDWELRNRADEWYGPKYDKYNLRSINDLIGNTLTTSPSYDQNIPYISGFMNFTNVRNVYICSSNIASLNVIGPRGSVSAIVKKVPVTADYGYTIVDSQSVAHDYHDVSKQTWNSLDFSLEDVYGNVLDLNNNPVSFSIILSTVKEDL